MDKRLVLSGFTFPPTALCCATLSPHPLCLQIARVPKTMFVANLAHVHDHGPHSWVPPSDRAGRVVLPHNIFPLSAFGDPTCIAEMNGLPSLSSRCPRMEWPTDVDEDHEPSSAAFDISQVQAAGSLSLSLSPTDSNSDSGLFSSQGMDDASDAISSRQPSNQVKVKRPKNAFMIWSTEQRQEVQKIIFKILQLQLKESIQIDLRISKKKEILKARCKQGSCRGWKEGTRSQ